ncbi:Lectin C-type domain protein [Marinobacterium sp. xm-g-48]|uniref:Ig-like domain-containing protein n=1 Tax=Marinobacterium sp. xm-g-48 TaxID=2497738 RepID=UPI0019DB7018|nr:Lectin C-type domain protein [Marinobacterium sp. xm-g-48]
MLYNGNRLITIDFGEQVTDFDVNDIVVTNGIKVTSGFTEVQAGQVYTLEVAPTAAAQDNPTGDVTVTLRKGTMTDSLGNLNAEQSIARPWDIRAPEITRINAESGSYTAGDTIAIAVTYDEVVNVDAVNGTPFLALNNGQVAEYVRGSESNTLVFEYTVVQNDQVDALNVQALVKDGANITDNAGNDAKTYITPGANLSNHAVVEIDGVAPTIVTISAVEDALYLAGDSVELTVQFSENVYIDFTNGSPILALSNGAVAEYVDGDGSSFLNFRYTVQPNDFDTTDLDVHALITNGSVFRDISGNEANMAILSDNSRLAYRSDVVVDAATPYIKTISANAGHYNEGEIIDIALGWNKPVEMNDALGTPELKLSNGEIATYNAAASTPTRLVFSYAVQATDFESDALAIAELRTNYATFNGVVAGESADLTLPNGGAIAQAEGGIFIDLTLPEVESISVLDENGSADLSAGEAATLTITFNGAVKELRPEFFNVENGSIGEFETTDNVTWTAVFTPLKDTQAGEQSLSLNLNLVSDLAGNFGEGDSPAASYTLDSAYPTVTIRSDADGIVNGDVRMVVNFSESVQDFDLTKLSVEGGTIDQLSLETPDNSGRPEGEYSFVVTPDRNSTQPIKVRVMDGVVTDEAGNPNKASDVLLQPVDTVKAKIEGIHAEAGAYAVGDTVQLTVKFTEEVALEDRPDDPDSPRLPTLFLNNGELATYVSGSGSDEWVFEYTYSADHAEGHPLQVITFLENDKLVVDEAGNRANTILGSNNRLQESVVVDGTEPVVLGFSSVEATYNSTEASENGMYNIGDVIWIKLTASEWLNVDTTEGRPTLLLENGGTATYVSGTGSNTLLFRYDVQDDDLSTDSLTVASVSFNDGLITDAAGNALVADSFNNAIVAGHVKPQVEVDTDAPIVETVSIVETVAINDTGATVDATNDGYYSAGTTIAFEVKFDDVINVDTSEAIDGSPVLALSNGQLATYVEGDGTDTLRFEYTVSADDINTTDLEVLGLAEQGAVLTDDAGNPALVEMVTDRRNYTTAVVDTHGPESVGTSDSFTENADGEDIVRTLETLSYTFEFNEMMDLLLATVAGVDPSIDPADTATIEQIVADNQAEILSYFSVTLEEVDPAIHVRVDGDGDLLSDVNDGLVATNFRFESNEDGTLDLTKFTVDVTTPDRTYADLHVGLNTEKFVDFAQNEPMDATIVATQRVDTQSFDLTAIPVAGLFITDTSTVRVLDANGEELVAQVILNPETGQASVRVSPNEAYPGGYRGPVLVEVIDSDPDADYIDEFTGQGVSLAKEGETVAMRAMFNIVEPGEVTVTVSPVTELAVKKLQETMASESVSTFDVAKVNEYNSGIGRIFGIDDIVKTAATVVNSATVEAQTGVDVTDFNATDGIDASEKYGQVLAMLSARDSATGSLTNTITDLAADIKVASLGKSTAIAITQSGADKLADTLKSIETAAVTADPEVVDQSVELNDSGVNTGLIDVSYIESAAGNSYGINLDEAKETRVPVKGAAEGDTVFVQWGVNTATGEPNLIEYVVTADDVAEDGAVTVPVSIDAIALQMDSKEVPIRTAVIKPDAVDIEGNPVTAPSESDFTAPVLLQVDIIPPETTVEAPTAETPFEVSGAIEGLNAGDDFFILINNSADERFKYKVESTFLGDEDAELPAGLSLENIVYDEIGDTWAFDWSFDLTQAISVAELAAAEADPDYTPVPTFSEESETAVFQVDAATSDLVGNAAEDNSRNEFIIGTASDLVDSDTEVTFMDQVLDRLTERYEDEAVDTRSEIQTIANAVNNLEAIAAFDAAALSGSLVAERQSLVLSADGSVAPGQFALNLGGDAVDVDLSGVANPSVLDIVDAIRAESGYADKNYTVALSADGNSVEISYKAFGPQPESSAISTLTETLSAAPIDSTIDVAGDIANFAVQSIAVDGAAVENGFAVSPGQIRLSFGGVNLDLTAAEGDLITDLLADAQAAPAYADLPFTLAVNDAGDSLVGTWKQVGTISDTLSLNRDYEQTTETSVDATSSTDGDAGISTAELQSLDIQNVDDSKLRAINKALAENLAQIKSEPSITFADQTLAAGDDTTVTLSFPTRVGQVPDDVLALVGGDLSTEGVEGAPIWSTVDGINWTATFTASIAINNTSLRYEPVLDEDGVQVLDANGDPKLAVIPTVDADGNPTGEYESIGLNDLRQVSLVEALVNRVTDASDTVKAFASEQGDTPAALPSVQDFADMSVEGVADDNLSAVQDALSTVRDRFEGEGDLFTQIETVVDSYNAVFDTVYAETEQPTPVDLIEDLNNIGVSNLSSDAARAEDQTTLLQGALREVAAAKTDITDGATAAEQQADMINSVAKLESFVTSVENVLARANGETVDVDGTATPVAVSDADLTALGFGDLLQDESANSRLSALQKVLLDQSEGEGSDAIVNYADLKAVLNTASDAFDAIVGLTATAQDTTHADADARAAAVTAALAEVDADSFQNMGIDGVTDVNIGSMTGDEMAAAVKDALSNTPNDIVSLEAIQAVVDSYSDILATAQDDAGTIEVVDLTNIGVTLEAGTEEAVAELASGIIATFGTADVSSVSDVQAKIDAINSVFANTLRTSDTDTENTTVVSKDELHTLGFDGATDDNLDAIQRVLSDQSDESDVKSYADLKQLIDNAVNAHADILAAATTDDLTDIDTTDYTNMGIDGVSGDLSDGDDTNDGNLAAINDALINTDNSLTTAESVQEVVDSYNTILETATNDSGTIDVADLTNIGVELEAGTEAAVAELTSGVIASLGYSEVDTVAETQDIVDAIDAVFANTLRTSDDDATHTTVVSKEQLHTLGFVGATDDNLDAIQRVLSDQTDESDVKDYAALKQLIDAAIAAHSDILTAASTDDLTGIDEADYAAMGIDGVDTDNLSSINDALINTTNTLDTAASIQEVVDSYNHILDLRADGSGITLDAADFTDLGVTLKADNANQAEQLAYLQEIVASDLGSGDITTVSGLQALANATSDLIDLIQGNSPDSDGTEGLTIEQWALLGVTAADAEEVAMLNARLALTADDLSDVTNLATDLAARVEESRNALAKIEAYANADGASDFDADGTTSPTDTDDIPTVQDYSFIGVVDYDAGNSTRVSIDATNIATINELFAAALVGADEGDDPASTRTEVQAVIDGAADRLGAFAKIVAYAEANVLTPADSSLIPTAADFALCGASGVADNNNIPALLTKLAAMGSSSNGLAVDTTPELQAFVKQVAIEKIKAWTDTDGGNGAAPILQDYLNADLVSYDDSAITEAMVPALNELFAGSLTAAGDADDQAEQQQVIDGAAAMLAAMAKIANYAEADGAIDLDGDADTGDANGYDHLTVADFEAAGISGVADGTDLSVGTGTSTSASGYNNLEAVLNKLADSGIKYLNADTLEEVQALVANVAAEKIAYYADQDGQWPAVSESYALYTDVRADAGGNAFFIDGTEAPTLDLKPGTYTFDLSQASMAGTDLAFSINADGSGGLPAGVTLVTTGTAGQAGASAVLTVPQGYEGTLHYIDANSMVTGGSAVAEKLYFAPEVQDYTNAGLVDPNDNAITAQHLPFVNAIFAKDSVGHTDDAPNNLFDADDATSQQAAIDAYGANMLSLMKFVDYMLTENGVVKADFSLADFTNAGLLRVDGSSMSGVLDRLPGYEVSDTLDRDALNSVDKIQAFISRAIIAEYNDDPANNQAPVGADYVAAGINGADDDNAAAMNYQVAQIASGSYSDSISAIEALVTPANTAINKLATFDLDHIDPISNDSQIVIGRSHDGTNFVAQTLTLADFGDYADPSSDAQASIKITALPAAGTLELDGTVVSQNDSISVADINDGKLTYTPASTNAATSLDFSVIDADGNESAEDYTLSIDREDFSPAVGIANSGLVQADTGVYSGGLYVNDALTGFESMSSLRVVITATGGDVKIGNLSGATQIQIGFDYATTGGDEICIEGTQAQINAALKTLQTKITSGNEKVDISIDVQPGGMVYNPENDHFYEYVASSGITWDNAKAAAEGRTFEGMTGYLATPTSANENAFIASKVSAQAWIGASDVASEGVWKWMTGPEAGTQFWQGASGGSAVNGEYANWASGEPNDSGGEDHAHYLSSGMWNDFRFNNSSIQGYMVEYGGMPNDVPTVKAGVKTLTVYATEALGNVSMTVSDFEQAGVTGVTTDNLASINQVLSGKSAADVDTNPELQSVVNGVISAIAKIEDFNNGANGVTTLDVADYEAAGIVGVAAGNKDAFNSAIQALNTGGANTTAEIQAAVAQVRIETYADATDATGLEVPTVADYHALGIYAVDASNLAWVNSFALDAASDLADNTAEIELLVQEALEMKPYFDAVAKISAYADSDGNGTVPTLEDYVAAQVKGVNEYNLGMANALFADSAVGTGDTTLAGTQSEQQSVINAASTELSSYAKIVSYAANNGGEIPTATDYSNIGLAAFPSEYVAKLNALLLTQPIGRAEVDELSEIEALASRIKITEYANANGFAIDGTTDLAGDFVPSITDYENLGITQIFNGTQMVDIDANNLEQVNDVMRMRYVGDGARVDVIDNATDAASNETNLAYANTVDTAAEIEDAIRLAMGETVDSGNSSFGLRAAALDKIAAFAETVSNLADQAAYDAYVADSGNAASIPSADDYNNAGVLGITNSTAEINESLAAAINTKLFTGGANGTVNTVVELQPFVDSANEIVNKIGAWAEPDLSGIMGTVQNFISLIPEFENAGFDTVSGNDINGWTTYIGEVNLGVTVLAGFVSPVESNVGADTTAIGKNGTNYLTDLPYDWNQDGPATVSVVDDPDASGRGNVLSVDTGVQSLGTSLVRSGYVGSTQYTTGTNGNYPYGIIHGPAIYSNEAIELTAGATISVDWKATAAGDAADVLGYLVNVNDGSTIKLLDYTSPNDTTETSWQTKTVTVPADATGSYKFVFVGGSFDYSGGQGVGAEFLIDNIDVRYITSPYEFNGLVNSNGADDWQAAQALFDKLAYSDNSDALVYSSSVDPSQDNPLQVGWYDMGDMGVEPSVLDHFIIHAANTTGDYSKLPADFDIMGWDNNAGEWEVIKTFSSDLTSATQTTVGSLSAAEIQQIVLPALKANTIYDLNVGGVTLSITSDTDPTVAEIAAAFNSAATSASAAFTVTESASGTGLDITWTAAGVVTDTARFMMSADNYEASNGSSLTFDVSDVDAKAYTGFKINVREAFGGAGIEMTELELKAAAIDYADLPSGSEPTYQDYNAIGFTEVDANNVADINALVFAKESAADVSTLPQIKPVIDTYLDAMGRIEAFANGDGAADTDGDFTADTGETGVPTVADYQAIGMRFVVNSDGLNVPISNDNIAAINEVIAGASYGDDSGDTAITTAAELRAVLNSGAIAARLAAIAKISELATVIPNSVTLADDTTTPTVGNTDTVNLTLTGPYGAAQVLTATMTSESGWGGIAAELSADLGANSGFVITAAATGGLTITRADGATFSVAVNDGTGDWSLSDGNSNTLSLSSGTAAGIVTVNGDGSAPSVADFTAAGVTTVSIANIAEVVEYIVAGSADSEFDTSKEISSVVTALDALKLITDYAEADGTGTAPDANDFASIGVSSYDSAGTAKTIDASNIDAIRELLKETSVGTQGSDTYTLTDAASIQSMLNSASIVARLDAIAKIAAYAEDSITNAIPDVADYAALGITLDSNALNSANASIEVATAATADTLAEISALMPAVPYIGMIGSFVDPSETVTLNVGDSIEFVVMTTTPLDHTAGGVVQATLDNGATVLMRPEYDQEFGRTALFGVYTVAVGDGTSTDLDITGFSAVNGQSLPVSSNGTPLELAIPAGVASLASRFDIVVTDYEPPRIESLSFASDTGLFNDDLVTATAYQSDTTNGALTGSFSPVLDAANKFVAISTVFDGQTVYDADSSFKNSLSALDNGDDQLFSDPLLGQWLSDSSSFQIVVDNENATIADGTYSLTFSVGSGTSQTLSYTSSSGTVGDLLDGLFVTNNTLNTVGFETTRGSSGFNVQRFSGEDFTVSLSQDLLNLGVLKQREFVQNTGEVDTLITGSVSVTNGATDYNASFTTEVKQGALATVTQHGDGSNPEIQTVNFQVDIGGDGRRQFTGDLRFGSTIVELAWGFNSTSTDSDIVSALQGSLDTAFGANNPDRPTLTLGSIGAADSNGHALVDMTFTWNHNSNANVGYQLLVDDGRSEVVVEQSFDFTLDQTAANSPVLSGASSNALTASEGTSIDITGVETGEYLYFIEANAYAGLTDVSTNSDQHMQDIFALSSEKWTRVLVGENVTTTDTVSFTVDGLMDGSYKLVAMDLAGNFSAVSSDTLTVTGSSAVNTDLDVAMNAITDTSDGDGSTVELLLDINEAVAGDTVEIWIDGVKVDEHELTAAEVTVGSASVAIDVDANGADTGTLNDVNVQIAVRHGSFDTQTETEDSTVNYTWS